MISTFDAIKPLLDEINSHLNENVAVYAIGGIVLMHRGLKSVTLNVPESH